MNKNKYILHFILVLILVNATHTNAQTFPFTSGNIPLCDTVTFTANVSGVNILQPPGPGPGSTLTGVTINVTSNHPQTLKITLTSPFGTDLLLAEFLGAGGSNYSLTNFTYSGSPSITTGSPPFTGNFTAQGGSFSIFDGEDPNGPWVITIIDTACINIPPGGTGGGPWVPGYFNGSASADGGIAIGGGAGPLPVMLLSLDAKQNENVVEVEWSTASEVNNDHFDVERSNDLEKFDVIGKVDGNGTTTSVSNYLFVDESPNAGIQYYRLKQTDFDGRTAYYGPVAVDFRSKDHFQILAVYTQAAGGLHLTFSNVSDERVSVLIQELSGRQVYKNNDIESNAGKNEYVLQPELSKGIYVLTLMNEIRKESVRFFY